MSITCQQLTELLDKLLTPELFADYGPNGLQLEGKKEIKKIAFAVSATKFSIAEAIKQHADALIVHHGLFWKYQGAQPIVGTFAQRIIPAIKAELNLIAYHLPLDGHPQLGNAAQLAQALDLTEQTPFGEYKKQFIGVKGKLNSPLKEKDLQTKLEKILDRTVTCSSVNPERDIKTVGILTGGASGSWKDAYDENLDAFITGEMREYDWHLAQEHNISMFAGGHHATERFGVWALEKEIKKEFPTIETLYIELDNPV